MDPITLTVLGVVGFFGWREWQKRSQKMATRQKVVGPSGTTWVTEFTSRQTAQGPLVTTYVYFALPTTGALPLVITYEQVGNGPKRVVQKNTSPSYAAIAATAMKDFNVAAATAGYFTY